MVSLNFTTYLVTIPLRSTHGTGPQLIVMLVDDIPFTDTSVGAAVGAGKVRKFQEIDIITYLFDQSPQFWKYIYENH